MSEITKNEKALLKVIWKRNKVRYGLSVLWMIAVIVLEQLYLYPYMAGRFGNLVAVMIYILLILIVPYKLKVFQYFFDRSYEGQITAIEQHIPENILVNKSISDMMRNARYNSIGITSVQTESKVELWITSNQKKIKKTIMIDESCGAVPYREYDYIARQLLPDIMAYYQSEEGQREFAEWKAEQERLKTSKDNNSGKSV